MNNDLYSAYVIFKAYNLSCLFLDLRNLNGHNCDDGSSRIFYWQAQHNKRIAEPSFPHAQRKSHAPIRREKPHVRPELFVFVSFRTHTSHVLLRVLRNKMAPK